MKFDIAAASCNVGLETLSCRYAAAMDRRDRGALLSVFDSGASMMVEHPGHERGTLRGHDELGRLVDIIARWPRTLRIVAQGLYQVAPARPVVKFIALHIISICLTRSLAATTSCTSFMWTATGPIETTDGVSSTVRF
ncbi:MAG: hypothetical protein NVS4B6_04290 [Mycobacterium sp.]